MKKVLLFSVPVALAVVLVFACSRSNNSINNTVIKEKNASSQIEPLFSKEVGKVFPGDSGRAWMKTYTNGRSGETTPYVLHYADIKVLLEKENCAGIIYYNGVDGANWVVLPYGITSQGEIIRTDSVATQKGNISWAQAKAYVLAYQQMNPNSVKAHFFGSKILFKMGIEKGIKNIRFQIGLNGRGEQLIMSDADVVEPSESYDASRICPPMCALSDFPSDN